MRSFKTTASPKLLILLFLAIIPALSIALASPFWLGDGVKTHAAPAHPKSSTAQSPPQAYSSIACGL